MPTDPVVRVLIVDDNEDAGELLRTAVEAVGHRAEVASDGPPAIELARRFVPHVALLDIGLPTMDGYELAGHLRAMPFPIRLVALTGYDGQADRERATHAGFESYMAKPVDLDRLRGLLTTAADRR